MKDIDFTRALVHDSAKERYRSPLGAVAAGTRVSLKLAVRDFSFEKAYLVVLRDKYKIETEMLRDENILYAEYDAPGEPCVLWYWFSIRLSGDNWIYYGVSPGATSGMGKAYWNTPPAFQLTVFDKDFSTPNWVKGANMYQVFPDRFRQGNPENLKRGEAYHKSMKRDFIIHESWDEEPLYKPIEGKMYYQPCDYYGGDLAGIEGSLDYFKDMGIDVLYLNPIVDSASNHRYNTGDYLNADPALGSVADFKRLTQKAESYGIKIILDGVFSHTGDDSVYFNRYGHYDSLGAYQSEKSPYYKWYQFEDFPNKYKSWWGFETLPEVCEWERDWIDFVIENGDSVINTWLSRGAAGYRLDVADELPDETIESMRSVLKDKSQDNFLLGEVWEDATTKQSYGVDRKYALGRGLDSVMNYPFANATIDFLLKRHAAYDYKRFLVSQSQNYPKEMYFALMNLLSSHDIPRVRTMLGTGVDIGELSREQQARFIVMEEQDRRGAALQKLACAIQFSIPGTPSIYYGDETGMHGLKDPFNRRPYRMWDEDMRSYYMKMSNLRKEHSALKTGNYAFYAHSADTLSILRFCVEGADAFSNFAEDEILLTAVNRSDRREVIVLDLFAEEECLTDKQMAFFRDAELLGAQSIIGGGKYEINEGLLEIELPPCSVDIVEILWT